MGIAFAAALVVVGTVNREMTGLLLVLAIFADNPRHITRWGSALMIWGVIVIGLRVLILAPNPYSVLYVWELNTTAWRWQGAVQYIGLLLPIIALIYYRVWTMPRRVLLMIASVLVPYMALWVLFATYQEVRLLMPLLILGVPAYAFQSN